MATPKEAKILSKEALKCPDSRGYSEIQMRQTRNIALNKLR